MYINRRVARRNIRGRTVKTNGRLGDGASLDTLSGLRGGLGVSVDPGQREGYISRRSDKFGPDYAAVTFIFIEILHPNDQPYFSIGGRKDFALLLSSSCFVLLRSADILSFLSTNPTVR